MTTNAKLDLQTSPALNQARLHTFKNLLFSHREPVSRSCPYCRIIKSCKNYGLETSKNWLEQPGTNCNWAFYDNDGDIEAHDLERWGKGGGNDRRLYYWIARLKRLRL